MTEPNIPIGRPSAPIEPTEVTLPSEAGQISPKVTVNKPPIQKPWFKVEEIELALRKTKGRMARAGRLLGCTAKTIAVYCDKHPALRAVQQELLDGRLDMAEDVLDGHMKEYNLNAATFLLKHKGSSRGYAEASKSTNAHVVLNFTPSDRDAEVL
jgi:hypothetical protein